MKAILSGGEQDGATVEIDCALTRILVAKSGILTTRDCSLYDPSDEKNRIETYELIGIDTENIALYRLSVS